MKLIAGHEWVAVTALILFAVAGATYASGWLGTSARGYRNDGNCPACNRPLGVLDGKCLRCGAYVEPKR